MNKITVNLPIKPVSINSYYTKSGKYNRVITGKGLAFKEEFLVLMEPYADKIRKFFTSLDMERIELHIIYSYSNYFTKSGSINKKMIDADNPNKPVIDNLFKLVGMDDNIVGRIISENRPAQGATNICIHISKYDVLSII
jgi:hypothetical protein